MTGSSLPHPTAPAKPRGIEPGWAGSRRRNTARGRHGTPFSLEADRQRDRCLFGLVATLASAGPARAGEDVGDERARRGCSAARFAAGFRALPATTASDRHPVALPTTPAGSSPIGSSSAATRGDRDREGVPRLQDAIFAASGFGNTFLVKTRDGNVIIDTSISFLAPGHVQALRAIDSGPVKYIILTRPRRPHRRRRALKEDGTQVIAQRRQIDFLDTEKRPWASSATGTRRSSRASRLAAAPTARPTPGRQSRRCVAGDVLRPLHGFELGGLTFQIVSTPGETPDHATVWIPQYKIAFPGDNFYPSFPNLYTLRGTSPRYALDYVDSLDRVLSWNPEILAPSHGDPIFGREAVRERMQKYRDAILYVHDETVRGINAGKDPFTLMREVRLPPALQTVDTGELRASRLERPRDLRRPCRLVRRNVRTCTRRRLGDRSGSRRDGRRTGPRRGRAAEPLAAATPTRRCMSDAALGRRRSHALEVRHACRACSRMPSTERARLAHGGPARCSSASTP